MNIVLGLETVELPAFTSVIVKDFFCLLYAVFQPKGTNRDILEVRRMRFNATALSDGVFRNAFQFAVLLRVLFKKDQWAFFREETLASEKEEKSKL